MTVGQNKGKSESGANAFALGWASFPVAALPAEEANKVSDVAGHGQASATRDRAVVLAGEAISTGAPGHLTLLLT